jgi:hypothetical protein
MIAGRPSVLGRYSVSTTLFVFRALVLLLPACMLLLGVWHTSGSTMLMLGAAFQLLVCFLTFLSSRSWRQPLGPSVITLYLIALAWLWMSQLDTRDWYTHLSESILLIVPLIVFAYQTLNSSGAMAIRRACILAQRLEQRKDWPADLSACRNLPEVKALREALYPDAAPALRLLAGKSVPARVAALAALEFFRNWRPGQVEFVLKLGKRATEPAIRGGVVAALANVDDRIIIEDVAEFLQDRSPGVRRSATEALLWNCEHRWGWIRHAVRLHLSNPAHSQDGPLQCEGMALPKEAVTDLHAWATEKGALGIRAAQTLRLYYTRLLHEKVEAGTVEAIKEQVTNPHSAAALRIELAQLLQEQGQWGGELTKKLLDPGNPAPLRIMAIDSILATGPDGQALNALHQIARLPNREIALASAEVVQRRLGVDLGLPLGKPLPALHSRQAVEVTRRVMQWSEQQDQINQ